MKDSKAKQQKKNDKGGSGKGQAHLSVSEPPTEDNGMLIGATVEKADIPYWEPKLESSNKWMRVFPNSDGLPPVHSDERYDYLRRIGCKTVFVSSKLRTKFMAGGHGTFAQGLAATRDRIVGLLNNGFDTVYYVENHEPEGDKTPEVYKSDFEVVWAMKQALPDLLKPKIRVGHALTRQWTENTSGRDYSIYDPGTGDFLFNDFYGNSWSGTYTDAVQLLQKFKNYKFNAGDTRDRGFAEFGYVGLPYDTDGGLRASWLQAAHTEIKTWGPATTGWNFIGWIWWNASGKEGNALPGIGTKRYFQLDRRHTGNDGGYAILNPPKPLDTWKAIALAESNATPAPSPGTYEEGYEAGYAAGRASRDAEMAQARRDGVLLGRTEGETSVRRALLQEYSDRLNAAIPTYEN